MSTIYLVLGAVAVIGAALWIAVASARKRGAAETEAEHNTRAAENAETMGRVIAEHREPEDAAKRLDSGTF